MVILAGFVFTVTYMKSLTKPEKKSKKEAKNEETPAVTIRVRRMPAWAMMAVAGLLAAGITGGATWTILTYKPMTVAMVSPEPEGKMVVPITAVTPAAEAGASGQQELGMGGPDIVRVIVPAGGAVNIRATSAVKSAVVTRLTKTTEVIRLAESAQWVQVALDDAGTQGWVAKEFVEGHYIGNE